jgi:hypothetical protein
MACTNLISKAITNSCDTIPIAGMEAKGWLFNRSEVTFTLDGTTPNLVTALTMEALKTSFPITAIKKENNAGFDVVTGDNIPDTYTHYFSFQPYERDAASILNFDSMGDVVLIAELKGEKTEGTFVVFGLEAGLFKSSGTQRVNDNNGIPTYEFSSLDGQGERYSRYIFWDTDYATSKASLIASET